MNHLEQVSTATGDQGVGVDLQASQSSSRTGGGSSVNNQNIGVVLAMNQIASPMIVAEATNVSIFYKPIDKIYYYRAMYSI